MSPTSGNILLITISKIFSSESTTYVYCSRIFGPSIDLESSNIPLDGFKEVRGRQALPTPREPPELVRADELSLTSAQNEIAIAAKKKVDSDADACDPVTRILSIVCAPPLADLEARVPILACASLHSPSLLSEARSHSLAEQRAQYYHAERRFNMATLDDVCTVLTRLHQIQQAF